MPQLFEDFIGGATLNIDHAKALEINHAIEALRVFDAIERLFSLVANAYLDFEKYLVVNALEFSLGAHADLDMLDVEVQFETARDRMNLLLLSLLNSHSAYCDQIPQLLKDLPSFEGLIKKQKELLSEAFDNSLEYRIFCGLRNYAQHRELPIYGLNYGSLNQLKTDRDFDGPSRLRVTFSPYLSCSKLISDSKIRKKTKAELEQLKLEKLDIKTIVRGSLSAFSECQTKFREQTAGEFSNATAEIERAYLLVTEEKGSDARFLRLRIEQTPEINTYLIKDHSRRIEAYRSKWRGVRTTARTFISSEIVYRKDTFVAEGNGIWTPK